MTLPYRRKFTQDQRALPSLNRLRDRSKSAAVGGSTTRDSPVCPIQARPDSGKALRLKERNDCWTPASEHGKRGHR